MAGVYFFEKKEKKNFPLKSGPLGDSGDIVHVHRTLVRFTVKTDTTDIQTVDSDCSKTIHQEMEEVRKIQETRDDRVEKRMKLK